MQRACVHVGKNKKMNGYPTDNGAVFVDRLFSF